MIARITSRKAGCWKIAGRGSSRLVPSSCLLSPSSSSAVRLRNHHIIRSSSSSSSKTMMARRPSPLADTAPIINSLSPNNGLTPYTNNHSRTQTTLRFFSSSSSSHQVLLDLLSREHAEEVENNETSIMPPDLANVKAAVQEIWKVVDDDDSALTRLYRTLDHNNNNTAATTKVQISFHCQDTIENTVDDGVYEPTPEDDEVQQDGEEEEAVPVRFTITISKGGKTLVMVCLTTEDVSVAIQSVAMTTTEDVDAIHQGAHGGAVRADQYQGPEFTELAEDLQDAFHNYLLDHVGLSEDVITFIAMYCDYKEQEQYVEFLAETKSLLS